LLLYLICCYVVFTVGYVCATHTYTFGLVGLLLHTTVTLVGLVGYVWLLGWLRLYTHGWFTFTFTVAWLVGWTRCPFGLRLVAGWRTRTHAPRCRFPVPLLRVGCTRFTPTRTRHATRLYGIRYTFTGSHTFITVRVGSRSSPALCRCHVLWFHGSTPTYAGCYPLRFALVYVAFGYGLHLYTHFGCICSTRTRLRCWFGLHTLHFTTRTRVALGHLHLCSGCVALHLYGCALPLLAFTLRFRTVTLRSYHAHHHMPLCHCRCGWRFLAWRALPDQPLPDYSNTRVVPGSGSLTLFTHFTGTHSLRATAYYTAHIYHGSFTHCSILDFTHAFSLYRLRTAALLYIYLLAVVAAYIR